MKAGTHVQSSHSHLSALITIPSPTPPPPIPSPQKGIINLKESMTLSQWSNFENFGF